jgi:hypothetical protein
MRHRFRLGRGAWLLPVLGTTIALAAAVPSVAAADTGAGNTAGFDPQGTNTPYLAWTGETVRLEKCIPNTFGLTTLDLRALGAEASFNIESWTGDHTDQTTAPQFQTPTIKLFISKDFNQGAGGICAMGDVVANTPGLARIELDVTGLAQPDGQGGYGPAIPFLAHEFLAGWMQLNQPSLTHKASSDFVGNPGPTQINDGSGSGNPTAGGTPDYLDVTVTGTIPLSGNPQIEQMVGQSSVTLPQDWAVLANALAVDDSANNGTAGSGNAADMWDTSGDNNNTSGHAPGACDSFPQSADTLLAPVITGDSGAYTTPLDNGDNCSGGSEYGPFSYLNDGGTALSTSNTVGPFDPTDAPDTDLANGDLNAQDAPMPAALVDLAIAPNSGSSSDTSGVGSLQPADKTVTYSRDFLGDDANGNLYAPFYDAFIPATARPTDNSSGIDGAFGNDFTGFINIPGDGSYRQYGLGSSGLYHFWDTAVLDSNLATTTSCLNSGSNPPAGDGTFRQTPSGPSEVDVYTDQNGEAQVQYLPGEGYYFDNLGADTNLDGGCDLQGIDVLGTASITATAEYPYKPTNFPQEKSAPLTETVHSLFDKDLSYVPKGTGAEDQNSRIVISHAQDIDGTPYAGETVCFTTNGGNVGVTRFTGYVNGVYYGGSSVVQDPNGGNSDRFCLQTDDNGNAAIEVLDSNPETVDVIADYTNEGLLRHIDVDFGTPGSSSGTPPSGPTSTQPVETPQVVPAVGTAGTTAPGSVRAIQHIVRTRITLMRLVIPKRGNHFVMLRVQSAHRTARVAMTLRVRSGGHTRIVHRTITVRTNRMIKLLVPRTVTRIKGVHLIG